MAHGNQCEDDDKAPPSFGVRHLQCFLVFCGLMVAYTMRVNLSVAIVAMTDKNSTNPDFPEYHWSERTKSMMLSSFFWGYTITQIPAGLLSRKYGGKVLLFYGNLVNGVLAIATPYCAQIGGAQLLIAVRVMQGLTQGLIFPSTHTLLSQWVPAEERGILGTLTYTGSQFGTVLMLAASGQLASSALGWPSIFYISGAASLVWVVVWLLFGASRPADFKSITSAEQLMIERSLNQSSKDEESKRSLKTPWLKIFTSVPFLVLTAAHATYCWGYWTMLTQISLYMKNVHGKDIKSNALISALPYLAMMLLTFVFCGISNVLMGRKLIGVKNSRKMFNTIGSWIPAATIVYLGYMTAEESDMAVILLTITGGVSSAVFLGFLVNHIDLAPNFAGTLMGISNCVGNIMGVIAPLAVGFIVTEPASATQWRTVFFISGAFYFVGNLLFILYGEATIQPWNDPPQHLDDIKFTRIETQPISDKDMDKSSTKVY